MELKDKYNIDDLLEIMRILRSENGCPWDRVQTHQSIKKSLIEECYEAIDALDKGDDKAFANELGDVLLQVIFHSVIANERGAFCFDDVLYELCTKLITRHTHVFGGDSANSSDEALANWEKNKKKEKQLSTYTDVLNDVPHGFPALLRAQKIQKKAESSDIEFEKQDLLSAFAALQSAQTETEKEKLCGEFLFAAVDVVRGFGVDSETALGSATADFIVNFAKSEAKK